MFIFSKIMSWVFGLLFLIASYYLLPTSYLGSLTILLIALLLLPPIRFLFYRFTKMEIETAARAVAIQLLLITFGLVIFYDIDIPLPKMNNITDKTESFEYTQAHSFVND